MSPSLCYFSLDTIAQIAECNCYRHRVLKILAKKLAFGQTEKGARNWPCSLTRVVKCPRVVSWCVTGGVGSHDPFRSTAGWHPVIDFSVLCHYTASSRISNIRYILIVRISWQGQSLETQQYQMPLPSNIDNTNFNMISDVKIQSFVKKTWNVDNSLSENFSGSF